MIKHSLEMILFQKSIKVQVRFYILSYLPQICSRPAQIWIKFVKEVLVEENTCSRDLTEPPFPLSQIG